MARAIPDYYETSVSMRCMLKMCIHIHERLEAYPERITRLRATCFGPWVNILYDERDALLVHCILLSQHFPDQVPLRTPEYLEFHVGRHQLRFRRKDFCLITGFRFGVQRVEARSVDSTFRSRHFPDRGTRGTIFVSDLISLFTDDIRFAEMTGDDSLRLCYLLMYHCVFIGREGKLSANDTFIGFVDDLDAWEDFPWGSHLWNYLTKKLRHKIPPEKESCHLGKIWIYETFRYTTKCNYATYSTRIPRALGWHRIPKWKDIIPFIYSVDMDGYQLREPLEATIEERAARWYRDSFAFFNGLEYFVDNSCAFVDLKPEIEIERDIEQDFISTPPHEEPVFDTPHDPDGDPTRQRHARNIRPPKYCVSPYTLQPDTTPRVAQKGVGPERLDSLQPIHIIDDPSLTDDIIPTSPMHVIRPDEFTLLSHYLQHPKYVCYIKILKRLRIKYRFWDLLLHYDKECQYHGWLVDDH